MPGKQIILTEEMLNTIPTDELIELFGSRPAFTQAKLRFKKDKVWAATAHRRKKSKPQPPKEPEKPTNKQIIHERKVMYKFEANNMLKDSNKAKEKQAIEKARWEEETKQQAIDEENSKPTPIPPSEYFWLLEGEDPKEEIKPTPRGSIR